jgi:signal transduction histidine kinase
MNVGAAVPVRFDCMKSPESNYLNLGRRLTIALALLIALILGGNGLVILQFEKARLQTDRLNGVSRQLIAVLRLQESLLSFHQQLAELVQSRDSRRLATEAQPLRASLQDQTRQTKSTLAYLSSEFSVDPAFRTALDAIETTLPAQLHDITTLADAGDWDAARLRLENESRRMEATTSALVKSIDRDLDEELPRAVANMRDVQQRILLIVPATALSTVLIAAFFGWAIARRILELRMEARVSERTRIARDLHDTLLQSFQGVMLKFHAVTYLLPDRPAEAVKTLETAIEEARQAIAEGRDAVQGLRSPSLISNDLAQAIGKFGEDLAREGDPAPDFRVHVEGPPRELVAIVRDEVYRMVLEALRNAFKHAQAKRIEVEIRYDSREFRLRVRDDGKGIDAEILARQGRSGHYGLPGMHERAKLVGGKLAIWSEIESGAEIELTIPGSIAYTKPAAVSQPVSSKGSA